MGEFDFKYFVWILSRWSDCQDCQASTKNCQMAAF